MTMKYGQTVIAILIILTLGSCGEPVQQAYNVTPPFNVSNAPATISNTVQPAQATQKIKFKREGGADAFSLKPAPDGAKLVDAAEKEIARFNQTNNKIKIKNEADQVLGYIVIEAGYWKLENAEQTQELYILRRQEDGDYKLETGTDQAVYRIKKRDYGFEVETPNKESLYKIKIKDDKLVLRDASDQTKLYTKSSEFKPIALVCFGFDMLSLEQRAAFAYALNQSGG
jgi:hypothetical protein